MKIPRLKLRQLIENFILKEMNDNSGIVKNLNTLISDAKQKDEEFRINRQDVHQQPPKDDWVQIEMLVDSLGFNNNPPKELSIHSVVDAEEGEILADYLTYDQAVQFGHQQRLVPFDGFEGYRSDLSRKKGRSLYFVYADYAG